MILYNENNLNVNSTPNGKVCSYYYLVPESVSLYEKMINAATSSIDILNIFSYSEEFKYIVVREEEKLELQKLHQSVPIPVKGSYDDPRSKIAILL